jgi:hypothetical protein
MQSIKLFVMSFWIFFLLLIILTVDIPICFGEGCESVSLKSLFTISNFIALASLILLLLGVAFYYEFLNKLKDSQRKPVTVESVDNVNYEYFALLVTLISLLSFDYASLRGAILLLVILIILAGIFVKTELFYSNPSFAILGFHIYKADTNNPKLTKKILISREKIRKGDSIKYLKISEKVYFSTKKST